MRDLDKLRFFLYSGTFFCTKESYSGTKVGFGSSQEAALYWLGEGEVLPTGSIEIECTITDRSFNEYCDKVNEASL